MSELLADSFNLSDSADTRQPKVLDFLFGARTLNLLRSAEEKKIKTVVNRCGVKHRTNTGHNAYIQNSPTICSGTGRCQLRRDQFLDNRCRRVAKVDEQSGRICCAERWNSPHREATRSGAMK